MGHVGNAVCHNLLRKGYTVTAITDIKPDNCKGFPESIAVKGTAREVAELCDIVVSGKGAFINYVYKICLFLTTYPSWFTFSMV